MDGRPSAPTLFPMSFLLSCPGPFDSPRNINIGFSGPSSNNHAILHDNNAFTPYTGRDDPVPWIQNIQQCAQSCNRFSGRYWVWYRNPICPLEFHPDIFRWMIFSIERFASRAVPGIDSFFKGHSYPAYRAGLSLFWTIIFYSEKIGRFTSLPYSKVLGSLEIEIT